MDPAVTWQSRRHVVTGDAPAATLADAGKMSCPGCGRRAQAYPGGALETHTMPPDERGRTALCTQLAGS